MARRRRGGRRSLFGLPLPSRRAVRRVTRSSSSRRSSSPKRAKPNPSAGPRPASAAASGAAAGRWSQATHHGPAGSRSYEVYLPRGYRRDAAVPLLVLLQGCDQTAAEFVDGTRFTTLADRHGFVIAAPRQGRAHQAAGCWRWYETAHQAGGRGEPALVAGITAEMLGERSRWRVDPARVYVAGISAGGAMALTLAACYPDVFAAVGVHSAPPYRSAGHGREALAAMQGRRAVPPPAPSARMAPAVVFQGTSDPVVHRRCGDQVTLQWLEHDRALGADRPDRITRSRAADGRSGDGRSYTVTRWYDARGRKRLEYWRVDGLGHAWSGGRKDGSYCDPRGPRASTTMWRFFLAHHL